MGRPPKRSTIPYQAIEQTIREVSNLAAPDYMPIHVDLLGYIIIALTERIGMVSPTEYVLWRLIDVPIPPDRERLVKIVRVMLGRMQAIDPHEYNHCRSSVAHIATLQAADFSPKQKAEQKAEIERCLEEMASEPASKLTHVRENVAIQREMLIDYLMSEKFVDANNPKMWLTERWDRIVTLLTTIPCRCCYNSSHENFIREAARSRKTLATVAHTADTILAALHNSTPEFIRKRAKNSIEDSI